LRHKTLKLFRIEFSGAGRISVAGIGDAGSKTNSMEIGIIDPAYSKNKSAPPGFQRGALN